jgi:hypothetical protein
MPATVADHLRVLTDARRVAFFDALPDGVREDLEADRPVAQRVIDSAARQVGVPDLLGRYWADVFRVWRDRQAERETKADE